MEYFLLHMDRLRAESMSFTRSVVVIENPSSICIKRYDKHNPVRTATCRNAEENGIDSPVQSLLY